eukprot:CAMPEP_0197020812 /NCGR_PEP_ID=MMETSP1384-20130603/1694_1 /TAXON_ID=29189 /ORGANISM="Ammonia sp." /LENGTH=249 /DNA_ID=CAMNT_0042448507 /DNA_START=33 /DNA_END=785 /DNA_ORIENTATION=+
MAEEKKESSHFVTGAMMPDHEKEELTTERGISVQKHFDEDSIQKAYSKYFDGDDEEHCNKQFQIILLGVAADWNNQMINFFHQRKRGALTITMEMTQFSGFLKSLSEISCETSFAVVMYETGSCLDEHSCRSLRSVQYNGFDFVFGRITPVGNHGAAPLEISKWLEAECRTRMPKSARDLHGTVTYKLKEFAKKDAWYEDAEFKVHVRKFKKTKPDFQSYEIAHFRYSNRPKNRSDYDYDVWVWASEED